MIMIKYELKKLWNRPLVWLTLLGVLACHIVFINTNQLQYYAKEFAPYYEKYEGDMNETWKLNTIQKYNDYLNAHQMSDEQFSQYAKQRNWSAKKTAKLASDPETRLLEDYKYSSEFNVLSYAYEASHFKENIVYGIKLRKQELLYKYPDFDTSIVDNAYSELLENSERFSFTMDYGYRMMQGVFTIMIRSFIILMIAVLSSLFTREQASNTLENILVTRHGRKRMQKCKFISAFISAFIGWILIVAVSFITIYLTLGFEGANMYVQDFIYNACPYNLNSAQYLLTIAAISLLAALAIGACFAFLSAVMKKDSLAIIASVVIMLIPPFFNNNVPQLSDILFYHPSNFISGNYLLEQFNIMQIGSLYIPSLYIALGSMIMYTLISYCFIYFRKPENYLYDSRNASE